MAGRQSKGVNAGGLGGSQRKADPGAAQAQTTAELGSAEPDLLSASADHARLTDPAGGRPGEHLNR